MTVMSAYLRADRPDVCVDDAVKDEFIGKLVDFPRSSL
jgi:hypothetical protein